MNEITIKDYNTWMKEKGRINSRTDSNSIFFQEQEIWWCYLGANVGFEEDGKGKKYMRPILILKKFSKNTFIGLPLTTIKSKNKYVLRCDSEDCVFRQVLLSQLKMIDFRRLSTKITIVSKESFSIIRKAIRNLF
jgi:mRNA interferase MazF